MAFHIRDAEADKLVRELAAQEGVGITEAVKIATKAKLEARRKDQFWKNLEAIQDRIAAYPNTGLKADEAFYDSLNDE